MKILGIETSCDDTAIAVIEAKNGQFKILSSLISSQIEIHKKWGGVYPSLAKREHIKNLPPTLIEALQKAKLPISNFQLEAKLPFQVRILKQIQNSKFKIQNSIDAIAVTIGPGLEPCLWTGINFAKDLSKKHDLPIVPTNHIESHILVNFIKAKPKIPALALVVSGGHTQLILVKSIGKYKILGETRDDAAGECFDKTARVLGLEYPGGPAIAAMAKNYKLPTINYQLNLPRPMINSKDYDFSFSGLKTAVLYDFKKRKPKERTSQRYIQEMSKEIQQSIIDVLIKKTIKAAKDTNVKTIILAGGVSANKELKKQFKAKIKKELIGVDFLFPDTKHSTDNAVMTAIAGYYNRDKATKNYNKIKANSNLRV